ncbi:MAG: NUDIX domain-containing protein [Candidatus Aenigmatarchaeota archaeon]
MERVDWIPEGLYQEIIGNMPVPCVDLVVECRSGVLLCYRKNQPAKDSWYIPGGRVKKGETLEEAVHRVADEELGVEVEIKEQIGTFDLMFEVGNFDLPEHNITTVFHVKPKAEDFKSDDQHRDKRVFGEFPDGIHRYAEIIIEQTPVWKLSEEE